MHAALLLAALLSAPCDDLPLLGHDDFAVREAAQQRLVEAFPNNPTLIDILSREVWCSADTETRWRCWSILLRFERAYPFHPDAINNNE